MTASATITSPSIPVARPSFGAAEEVALIDALRSGWITQGPRVGEFEQAFADYVGCPHAIAVSSCTTALQLALLAFGIGPGNEVICPSLSFIATANAIRYVGAEPVFADVDRTTFNLDPDRVVEQITSRTKAILVVHQIGLPAEMDRLQQIADAHGLPLIEDAACAIGSTFHGQRIGAPIGAIACFSFHPRKILTTGEGGMLTMRDAEMAQRLRRLRQHAMSLSDVARHSASKVAQETYDEVGYNFRMTDLQAAIGMVQLQRLESFLSRRQQLASRYDQELAPLPWLETPYVPQDRGHNYQSYMIRLVHGSREKRDAVMQELLEQGISTRRAIMAIHREAPYKMNARDAELTNTNLITDTGLILPLYHDMTESEQAQVIDALAQIRL